MALYPAGQSSNALIEEAEIVLGSILWGLQCLEMSMGRIAPTHRPRLSKEIVAGREHTITAAHTFVNAMQASSL
jgi:hypothetical protein